MPHQPDGLIERAAALLPQRVVPHDETRAGSSQSPSQSGAYSGAAHSNHPWRFESRLQTSAVSPVEGEEHSLSSILRVISLHKLTLIASTLLFMAAAAAVILTMPRVYVAQAVVAVGNREP